MINYGNQNFLYMIREKINAEYKIFYHCMLRHYINDSLVNSSCILAME